MRIRTIKPDFFHSESIIGLSFPARYLYTALWCLADDHGQALANMRLIRAAVFPLEDSVTLEDVTLWFKELVESEHLHPYEVDGKEYFHVPSWNKHQSAAFRRSKPIHPAPTCMQAACDPLQNSAGSGKGKGEGEGERESAHNPDEAEI